MAEKETTLTPTLDAGTYEIIRKRLDEQRQELSSRLGLLNSQRKEIFNSTGFHLIGNQRITTENNGVARGIFAFGELTLFAYNVHFGLREDIQLTDVFSIYTFTGDHFEPQALTLIEDPGFITDFTNLYKYYRDSIFAKFTRTENYFYMVFQTSKNPNDRKAFKWLIKNDRLIYIDDRSIHEVKKAAQHEFVWIQTDLSNRRLGIHPHISILDKVFIEALNGDITFKIENNTDTGKGIFSEAVSNKDQQLDDALYFYADLGNLIVIKIQPYQEDFRAYIFNVRTKQVLAIPSLLEAAVLLPENQGIIFPTGYYLQNGEYKLFDTALTDLEFIRSVASPNGEDFLYVFYQKHSNTYLLMSYNMILQQVETPIVCNGFTIFDNGKLVYFRSENEAIRHHQVQIWQTPYSVRLLENQAMQNNVLYKIGNKDIVSAMSECQEIIQLIQKEDSYEMLYEDIFKRSTDILDSYFWIRDQATTNLAEPLAQIRDIANTAIDEFAKVQAQRKHASEILTQTKTKVDKLVIDIKNASIQTLDQLVNLLASTRSMQGGVIDLLNLRYIDAQAVTGLKEILQTYNRTLSEDTVQFLLREEALLPYEQAVKEQRKAVDGVQKVIDAQPIETEIGTISSQLELLIEILNSLRIEDSTQTTRIIEKISVIFASLNEAKAALARTVSALRSRELTGEFHAQLSLLEQTIVNFLDLSSTVQKCDDYYARISIQVEEMESKYADFEAFVQTIADKRDEIIKAFNTKKELLTAQINKRTGSLEQIGLRVLKNIENKAAALPNRESIYAFYSTDLMIEKIRNLSEELRQLGDVAKAENLQNLLKVSQETALRVLKDKTELFADGENLIALGTHRFVVNKQVLELTMVQQQEKLFYHLIGTSFYKEVKEEQVYRFRDLWKQELMSENASVYRAEYLAFQTFIESNTAKRPWDADRFITEKTEREYAAGYLKGVHNSDAQQIYSALKKLQEELGILSFHPQIRVAAQLFWLQLEAAQQQRLQQLISAAHSIEESFPGTNSFDFLLKELSDAFLANEPTYPAADVIELATYLYQEISSSDDFHVSQQATSLKKAFKAFLQEQKRTDRFTQELDQATLRISERFYLAQNWLKAFCAHQQIELNAYYIDEAATMLLFPQHLFKEKISTDRLLVEGLKGAHPVVQEGSYEMVFHPFLEKMKHFSRHTVPAFQEFNEVKTALIREYRAALKINEFEPKVLSSFVRNRLINEVYFPLIGGNLAKQIGAAGDNKRTARMGMLLLVSPPGYGKTTLMEYLAKTMGLHFVKINGPTIGHSITSIDPQEATTSGAREELKKINLAFEMADNVMLYIDDIQHCNPEFLQKFISLADGQRKMDGIFEGTSKTYDLRGKRFCVVMAGNPYTESGEQFKIPDMLANRADVYNLGDVTGGSDQLFQLSLIENAVAENAYLQRITNRSADDLYKLIRYLESGSDLLPDLEGNYNRQEIDDALAVLKNAVRVRDLVLRVNQQYIASAAMKDAYRTEPPFKLQGSYRNMGKLVNKLVPLMNDAEINLLLLSHYESESQTLSSDAEANMLKLKELAGLLTPGEQSRWNQIRKIFQEQNKFSGMDAQDRSGQLLLQLGGFNEQLAAIATAIKNTWRNQTP